MLPRTRRRGEQFHPEVTAKGPERWFIGHAFEIATNADLSVENLRAESARWAPGLRRPPPDRGPAGRGLGSVLIKVGLVGF